MLAKVDGLWKRRIYLLTFAIWFLYRQLALGNIWVFGRYLESVGYPLDYGAAAALVLQIVFLRKWNWKQALAIVVCTAFFACSTYMTRNWILLLAWLFMVASAGLNLDDILETAFYVILLAACVILLLFAFGLVEEPNSYRSEELIRHSLGYSHPNVLGMIVQELVLLQIYLQRKKLTLAEPLLCIAGILVCIFVADSRASVVCLVLTLFLLGYLWLAPRLPGKLRKAVMVLFALMPILCNIGSVVFTLFFQHTKAFAAANDLLSGRLFYPWWVYQVYGYSLFGNFAPIVEGLPVVIDNSFLILLLNFGLVSYILYSLVHIIGTWRVVRTGNEFLAGILTVFTVHAMMEKTLLELRFNVFLIALVLAIIPKPNKALST